MPLDIRTPRAALTSHAQALGTIRQVLAHEPLSSPGSGLTYAVWVGAIDSLPGNSGLSTTSAYVTYSGRLYLPADTEPIDDIDVLLTGAVDGLMNAYTGDFTLGGSVRNIDLLGQFGERLRARYGYLDIGSTTYRMATLTIPTVINSVWTQVT